jgi:hypothetical protein
MRSFLLFICKYKYLKLIKKVLNVKTNPIKNFYYLDSVKTNEKLINLCYNDRNVL